MITVQTPPPEFIAAVQRIADTGSSPIPELLHVTPSDLDVYERYDDPLPGSYYWRFPLTYPDGTRSWIVCARACCPRYGPPPRRRVRGVADGERDRGLRVRGCAKNCSRQCELADE